MSADQPVLIRLRRNNSSSQWGFSIQGGSDQNSCFYIQKVNKKSIAERSGLRPGDGVLKIGNVLVDGLRHDQAKMEIIRSGNELDFVVRRNVKQIIDEVDAHPPRSNVTEEPSQYVGYSSTAQSRSFRILQTSLSQDDTE